MEDKHREAGTCKEITFYSSRPGGHSGPGEGGQREPHVLQEAYVGNPGTVYSSLTQFSSHGPSLTVVVKTPDTQRKSPEML